MRILFAGTPEVAVAPLRTLCESHNVVAVLTRPDAIRSRGRKLTPSPVKEAALDLQLPVWEDNPNSPEFLEKVKKEHIDLAIVVAYGRLLRQPVLDAIPYGWYNLHFSLLPTWRGAAPVQRTIWANDSKTGVSIFQLTAGMDEGPLLLQEEVTISNRPNTEELMMQLSACGAQLLVQAVDQIETDQYTLYEQDDIESVPQDHRRAEKITAEDAHADFTLPASILDGHIRACNPDPGAWCTLHTDTKEPYLLHLNDIDLTSWDDPAFQTAYTTVQNPKCGSLIVSKKHVWVLCGGEQAIPFTVLELRQVTAQGKKKMTAADWARGARLGNQAYCD